MAAAPASASALKGLDKALIYTTAVTSLLAVGVAGWIFKLLIDSLNSAKP